MLPDVDFETDTEQLSPGEAHDRWEDVTNLQADDLREVKQSKRNEVYLDRAEGNQGDDDPTDSGRAARRRDPPRRDATRRVGRRRASGGAGLRMTGSISESER